MFVSFWILNIFLERLQLESDFLFLLSKSNTSKSLLSNFTPLFSRSAEILLFSSVVGFIYLFIYLFLNFFTCIIQLYWPP